ncbi:MAG: hypothetical protein R3E97_03915 [Candidatus Eisenbacteria bacterium]
MLKDYHPIEVLLGQDGSWAIEGVPDGRMGARKVFRFLLGQEPPANSYRTNPLWDWFYFPPGSLTAEQRHRLLANGVRTEQGSWTYKFHQVDHVEQPGQFTESFFDILKEPIVGRVVAGVVSFVLFATAGYFWVQTREAVAVEAGLVDVLAAAETPYVEPNFASRLAVRFSDGDRFSVPVSPKDVISRGGDSIVLAGFGDRAFFVQSEGIGETLTNEFQLPGAALEFDTRGGVEGIRAQRPDGSWNPATVIPLVKGHVSPGLDAAKIRFDDPTTFAAGERYTFSGGVERQGDGFLVFALPRLAPPYRVFVHTTDVGIEALLGYAADRSLTVDLTGVLVDVPSDEDRAATRVVGRVGSDFGLRAFRTEFVPGQGG